MINKYKLFFTILDLDLNTTTTTTIILIKYHHALIESLIQRKDFLQSFVLISNEVIFTEHRENVRVIYIDKKNIQTKR